MDRKSFALLKKNPGYYLIFTTLSSEIIIEISIFQRRSIIKTEIIGENILIHINEKGWYE